MSKQKHIAIKASKKSISSMILSILMLLSVIPLHSSTIYADGSRKTVMNGTGNIQNTDSIWFGIRGKDLTDAGSEIQWRVLDTNTNIGEDRLFLLSEKLIGATPFHNPSFPTPPSRRWQGSDAQKWCKDFSGENGNEDFKSLTAQELAAIKPTTESNPKDIAPDAPLHPVKEYALNGDKVFFLSVGEAGTYFQTDYERIADDGKNPEKWWLRSPYKTLPIRVMIVKENGGIYRAKMREELSARPAFNLDTTKVLFTSPAVGGKQSNGVGKDALKVVEKTNTTEWKLTLKDDSRGFRLGAGEVTRKGLELKIPYENATTGTNEYISAIIVEENGTITHYGTLKAVENSNTDKNGEVTVELPDGFDKKTDKLQLYLINEQLNGDKKTDYSSGLIPVDIPKESLTFEHKTEYNIPEGKQGITYTAATALSAKGGTEPYKFTVEPEVEGLSINGENKLVYTRPNVQEATTATIKVTDSANPSAEKTITINIGQVTAQKPTEYAITMETDGHGTATANPTKAKQGDIISINAEANKGFKFKEWQVVVGNPVSDHQVHFDKTYRDAKFKMPAEDVKIKATFGKLYKIDVKYDEDHGTAKATVDGVVGDIEEEIAGTKITLKATNSVSGYKFDRWEVVSGNIQLTGANAETTTFTMPDENVEIKAIFVQDPSQASEGHEITISTEGNGTASSTPNGKVKKDTVVTLKATPNSGKGYKFVKWQVESGNVQLAKPTDATTTFKMPDEDVKVKAIFEQTQQPPQPQPTKYKIKLTDDGNGTATASPSQAEQGKEVTITATAKNGYTFDEWKGTDNLTFTTGDKNSAVAKFTMPNRDVEIKAYFKKKSSGGSSHDTEYYNITTKTDKHGTVEARSKAREGTEVSVTVDPDKGYKLDEITVTDKRGRDIKIKETNRENRYKFTMPARDVTVEATFKQIKQEQPSKPTTPPTIPPTNNNKPTENNIIKKQQTTVFTIGSNIMTVITDGKATQTTIDAKPFLSQGRVMIPVRYAAESLGMQVEWNKQTQTVVLKDRENTVMIPIKTNKIIVGNQEYTSDVTPILKNGRTYLTISNIAKALRMRAGQDVKWDNKIKQVTIIKEVEVR